MTVTGVSDADAWDEDLEVTLVASGGDYSGVTASVGVDVDDSDTAGLVVSVTSLDIDEDGTGSFTVKLATEPSASVTVTVTSNDTAAATVSSALTFSTSDWGTAQTVTVTGVSDADAWDEDLEVTLVASGGDYANVTASVGVDVDDSDTAELVVSLEELDIGEDGSGSFTVKLATEPSASVTVTVTSNDTAAATVSTALTFTTLNWGTAQTVTVTGVSDADASDEDLEVTLVASGGDYANLTGSVDVDVDDSDTAGLVVSVTSLDIDEDGTGSFTVKLATQPSASVTVTAMSGDTAAATVPSAALTFSTSDWGTAQTVMVTGVADADARDESLTVSLSASSTDTDYSGETGSVAVDVDDSDTAGLVVSLETLGVSEDGSASFTVKLASRPSASVTVTVGSNDTGAATASPVTLAFSTTNWSTPKTVLVEGVSDADVSDETVSVTVAVSSTTDVDYQGLSESVSVSVSDTDTAGLVVSPSTLDIDEDGTGSFTVKLATQPSASVTVTATSGDTGIATVSAALTFSTSDWGTAQTVTVTGVADADARDESLTVSLSASSTDTDYEGETGSVAVDVDDSDTAGLMVSLTSLDIDEDGTGSFTVKLATEPSASVTVTVTSNDTAAATVSSALTFTTLNWGTAQTVTVTGVSDADAEDESLMISLVASGGDYANLTGSVDVDVDDSDTAELVVSLEELEIDEDGSGSFTVKLATLPSASVTVSVVSGDTGIATVPSAALTFSTSDWGTAQTVTVTGVADADARDESLTVSLSASSTDTDYSGETDSVVVAVADDDEPGLVVSLETLDIDEDGSGSFAVELATEPSASVTVSVVSGDTGIATVSSALTFSPSDWGTAQTVTVTGVSDADALDEGLTVSLSASSTDTDYSGETASVVVAVDDDDEPGLVVSVTSLDIDEDGTGSFTVKLATEPSASVTVTATSGDTAAGTVSSALTFSTSDWGTAQTVTVTGVSDADASDEDLEVTLVASGGDYANVTGSVDVDVDDSDTADLVVSLEELEIDEDGTGTFTVKLATEPSASVNVTVTSDDTGAATVSSALTFTTLNWGTAQTVTVTGVSDADAWDEDLEVTLVASGGDYANVTGSVDVDVDDSDTAELVVSLEELEIDEDGTGSFTVKLATQPSASVNVTATSNDTAAATVSSALTFSTSDWGTAQTVTVTGVADADARDESLTVSLSASSTDTDYSGETDSVVVAVADDDEPGLVVSLETLEIDEDGSGSFTVKLATEPSASVTVSVVSGDTGAATVSSALTFSPSDWGTAQTVTVTGVSDADALDEGLTVSLSASSTDTDYSGETASVVVAVDDDDDPGLVVSVTSLDIDEDGTGSFAVELATEPSASVNVTVTSNDTGAATVSSALVFSTLDWGTAQTVTVTGVADADALDEELTVSLSASGGDYANVTASVDVDVDDSDTAELVVSLEELEIDEDGTGTFTVKLATLPSASVNVTVTSNDTAAATVSTALTFSTLNWGTAQTVTVTGVSDADAEDESLLVSLAASGGDYANLTASVDVSVDDIDIAVDPAIVVSTTSLDIDEGSTSTFTVRLSTRPASDVLLLVQSDDTRIATVSTNTLEFTQTTWSMEQTVTVTSHEDDNGVDTPVDIDLLFLSGAPEYTDKTAVVQVSVLDNDTPGLVLNASTLNIDEGAATVLTIKLATKPSHNVVVTVTSGDTGAATVSKETLTFSPSTWGTAQSVTVLAIADTDSYDETVTVTLSAASPDSSYSGTTETVTVNVEDSAPAGIELSTSTLDVDEGGTATFTVKLETEPAGDVTVTVTSGDIGAATIAPTTALTFTALNWETAQTVTVTGVSDIDTANDTVTVTVSAASTDTEYSGLSETLTVTVDDSAPAGIELSPTSLAVDEGGTATFTVKLETEPAGDVTVTVTSGDTGAATIAPTTALTFTALNWETAQTVTVTAVSDVDSSDVDVTVTLRAASTDTEYSGLSETLTVSVSDTTDNALPQITNTDLTVTLDENMALSLQVVADDTDSEDAITAYTLDGGADSALFAISSSGVLSMVKDGSAFVPDFEDPQDASTPPDNEYEVVVKVTSGTADRILSATATFVVVVANVIELPEAPTDLEVTQENLTSLMLQWVAPPNPGSPLTAYDVVYTIANQATQRRETISADATTYLLSNAANIRPGRKVNVWIVARNADGDSPASSTVLARPDDCAASTVSSCSVTPGGGGKNGQINAHDTTPDTDWVSVQLEANSDYQIDVEGRGSSAPLVDPYVALYDETGTAIAGATDDNSGTDNNAQIEFATDVGGLFYIAVSESGGDATGLYRVEVTTVNHPPGFTGGDTKTVTYAEDNTSFSFIIEASDLDFDDGNAQLSIVQNATDGGADYDLFTIDVFGFVRLNSTSRLDFEARTAYELKVTATTGIGTRTKSSVQTVTVNVTDVECAADDTTKCEPLHDVPEMEDIGTSGTDVDWFKTTLRANTPYVIEVAGSDATPSGGTLADPVVALLDEDGDAVLVSNVAVSDADADADGVASITFVSTSTDTYYVTVSEDGADATGTYTLTIGQAANEQPRITNTSLDVSIAENSALSLQLTAVDDDSEDSITGYRISGGNDQRLFAVTSTGVLSMAKDSATYLPDFERPEDIQAGLLNSDNVYEVDVEVTSGTGVRRRTGTADITVTVTDVDTEAPGVPSGLIATSTDLGSIDFSWAEPVNTGPDPVSYALEYRRVGDTAWIAGTAGNLTGEATTLAAGTEYEAQVRAVNDEGQSAWNSPVSEWTDDCDTSTATTCTVTVGGATQGRIGLRPNYDDRDWLSVTLVGGVTYVIDVKGNELDAYGGTLDDPAMALRDANGNTIPHQNDDDGGDGTNARLTYTPSSSGAVYIVVYAARTFYRGTYTVEVKHDDDCTADTDTTCELTLGSAATGDIEFNTDADWFEVSLTADTEYRFAARGSGATPSGGTLADPVVTLYDVDGNVVTDANGSVTDSDSDSNGVAEVTYTPTVSGSVYIDVSEDGDDGAGTYTVVAATVIANSAPSITNTSLSLDLDENDELSLQITATDDDSEDSITGYSISGGTDMALFTITSSGVLSMERNGTAFAPDFEDPQDAGTPPDNVYEVQISVTSGTGGRELSTPADVTVTVIDVSTDQPEAPQSLRVVAELTTVIRIGWTAPANTDDAAVTGYRYTFSDSNGLVASGVTPNTEYMQTNLLRGVEYSVTVVALSADGDSLDNPTITAYADDCSGTSTSMCTVTADTSESGRINTHDTTPDHDAYGVQLAANTGYRFRVVGGIGTGLLAEPVLRLLDAVGSAVVVDGSPVEDLWVSGLRRAQVKFTPAADGTYFIQVAENGDDATGTYTVNVFVLNTPPIFDEGSTRTLSVAEGGTLSETVNANDDDTQEQTVEYSIAQNATAGGADYASFEVDANSGVLTLAAGVTLDFETKAAYAVKVTATSGAGDRVKSSAQTITVNVTDVECAADSTTECEVTLAAPNAETIGTAADVDWFELTLEGGASYQIDVTGGSGTDELAAPTVTILDSLGNDLSPALTDSDDGADNTAGIMLVVPGSVSVRYFVAVAENGNDATGAYLVSLTDVTDRSISELPNGDLPADDNTAGVVLVGEQVTGRVATNGDQDWFAVELVAERMHRIEVSGTAGNGLADPVVALYDDSGTAVSGVTDNDADDDGTASVDFEPDATATYFVEVSGVATATGGYMLDVTDVTPKQIIDLRSGSGFSCVLWDDGTPDCWGDNDDGQNDVPSNVRFASIGLGNATGCGITDEGSIDCWGSPIASLTTPPTGTDFAAVDLGYYHGCALNSDGTLECWGRDDHGSTVPPVDADDNEVLFSSIAVNWYYNCGITDGGSELVCWGRADLYDVTIPPTGSFDSVTLGETHACALKSDGTVECWGNSANHRNIPPTDAGSVAVEFSTISAGRNYTCGIRQDDSRIQCWGNVSEIADRAVQGEFGRIATGTAHVCAQRLDGDMFCWGANDNGEIDLPVALLADDCTADADSQCVIETDDRAHGNFETAGDVDWFSVSLEPDVTYKVYVDGGMDSHAVDDPEIVGLYDTSGVLQPDSANTDDGDSTDALTLFEHSEAAATTFSVGVGSQDSGLGDYWLWVSQRSPGSDVSEESFDLPSHAGTPGFVTVGGEATGTIKSATTGDDVDAFAVEMTAGHFYRVHVRGACAADPQEGGGTLRNPDVELRRADGSRGFSDLVEHLNPVDTLAESQFFDADSGACRNAELVLEAEADGLHYITVFSANSGDQGSYTVAVEEDARTVEIHAGKDFSCVRFSDNSVECWGDGHHGRTAPPTNVLFDQIELGPLAACGVTVSGRVKCWGQDDTFNTVHLPTAANFVWAGIGDSHGCALDSNGNVTCWANQSNGRSSPPSGVTFRSISVGNEYNCGVTTAAQLECWGRDADGRTSPPSGPLFPAVTTGANHACSIVDGGALNCWGDSANNKTSPPGGNFRAIDSLEDFTCGIKLNRKTIRCWGDDGDTGRVNDAPAPDSGTWVDIAVGGSHACALNDEGLVTCWGDNGKGQTDAPPALAIDDCAANSSTDCTAVVDGVADAELEVIDDEDWFAVEFDPGVSYRVYLESGDAQDLQIAGIYDDSGTVVADTASTDSGTSTDALVLFEHTELAAATYYVAANVQTGAKGAYRLWITIHEPDAEVSEQTGSDLPAHAGTPGHVTVDSEATGEIEQGTDADVDAFAVELEAGKPYAIDVRGECTSDTAQDGGTLADPQAELLRADGSRLDATLATHLNAVDTQSSSQFHDDDSGTCSNARIEIEVLTGGVYYVAVSSVNATDVGTYTVSVTDDTDYVVNAISAGERHTCAWIGDGSVQCWGLSDNGRTTPPTAVSFAQIELGSAAACGTTDDDEIECWGLNDLGNVDSAPAGNQFVWAGVGVEHGCGLQHNGVVECWGSNADGRATPPLDNGGDAERFSTISVGDQYSCGVLTGGGLSCWGAASNGRTTPPSTGSYTAVTAGKGHACAIQTDGTVACWGRSGDGRTNAPSGQFTAIDSIGPFTCGIKSDAGVACWGVDSADGSVSGAPDTGSYIDIAVGVDHACALTDSNEVLCWGNDDDNQLTPPSTLPLPNIAPRFTSPAEVTVDEHEVLTYEVVAVDRNGDTVTYSVTGGADQASFDIDPSSGVLTQAAGVEFDYETGPEEYTIIVTATSGTGDLELSTTQTVTITVHDLSEPAPAPDTPQLHTYGIDFVTLSWSVQEHFGPPLTDVTVQYREAGGTYTGQQRVTVAPDTQRSGLVTINGLDTDTDYVFRAGLSNDEGPSDWSADFAARTDIADDCTADTSTTCSATVGSPATGRQGEQPESDWFGVDLVANTHYVLYLEGHIHSRDAIELAEPLLGGVHGATGQQIAGTDAPVTGASSSSLLEFTPSATAKHYVDATRNGDGGEYRLWVVDQQPGASVSEPADDFPGHAGTSGHVIVGGSATGGLLADADSDGFGAVLSRHKQYRIEVKGECAADDGGDLANPSLLLRTIAGGTPSVTQMQHVSNIENTAFADDDSGECSNASLDVAVSESGVYYVQVKHSDDAVNPLAGTYTVTVTDISAPAVLVSAPTVLLDEGDTATYDVTLAAQPTAAVTVTVSTATGSGATVHPTTLNFTTSDWGTPQTVTVTGTQDADAADAVGIVISHSAAGGDYEGLTATVLATVVDDESAGVTVSRANLDVNEDGSATYNVKLDTPPTTDVEVRITRAGRGVSVSSASLMFTSNDWSVAQTVTVNGNVDSDADDQVATLQHRAVGGEYLGVAIDEVAVTVDDGDTRGVVVSATSLHIDEGDSATYNVKLETRPSDDVTIMISVGGSSDAVVTPATLRFTDYDWDDPQTVTVTARHDGDSADDSATLTHTIAGGGYDAVSIGSIAVTVNDIDVVGVTVLPTTVNMSEGDTASYALVLDTEPTGTVTVTAAAAGDTDITIPPTTLTFDASNWNVVQTVTVTSGVDTDTVADTATISHTVSGGGYGTAVADSVSVTVRDGAAMGVTVTPTRLSLDEPGTNRSGAATSGEYTMVLDSVPLSTVTVTLDTTGSGISLSHSTLTFTTGNWAIPKTVTVTAVADADAGDGIAVVTHSISGGGYDAVAVPSVLVTVDDPIEPPTEVTVTPGDSSFLVEWSPAAVRADRSISDYQIFYRRSGGGAHKTVRTGTATSREVTGLTNANDQDYEVTIRALDGSDSADSHTVTTRIGRPGAVVNLESKPDDLSVHVNWEPPVNAEMLTTNGLLLRYFVTLLAPGENAQNLGWFIDDTFVRIRQTPGGAQLVNGTEYQVKVTGYLYPTEGGDNPVAIGPTSSAPATPNSLGVASVQPDVLEVLEVPEGDFRHEVLRDTIELIVSGLEDSADDPALTGWLRQAWDWVSNGFNGPGKNSDLYWRNYATSLDPSGLALGSAVSLCTDSSVMDSRTSLPWCHTPNLSINLHLFCGGNIDRSQYDACMDSETAEDLDPAVLAMNEQLVHTVVHELLHVYQNSVREMTTDVGKSPTPIGAVLLHSLSSDRASWNLPDATCAVEILAVVAEFVTLGSDTSPYITNCLGIDGSVPVTCSNATVSRRCDAMRSMMKNEVPQWYLDRYTDDSAALWTDIVEYTTFGGVRNAAAARVSKTVLLQGFDSSFGGYCSPKAANNAMFDPDTTIFNPWVAGGCEPDGPATATATEGSVTDAFDVIWTAPRSVGGATISGYEIKWKRGSQNYDSTRTTTVTAGTLSTTITATGSGTVNIAVTAVNEIGTSTLVEVTCTESGGAWTCTTAASTPRSDAPGADAEPTKPSRPPAGSELATPVDR